MVKNLKLTKLTTFVLLNVNIDTQNILNSIIFKCAKVINILNAKRAPFVEIFIDMRCGMEKTK